MSIRRTMPNMVVRLGRLGPAAVMRTLAGAPGGVRPARRGTILVLILGALALISVVTLIYATVGQGDRRASAVVVRKDNTNHFVGLIGDYLASTVGNDAVATFVDGYEPATNPNVVISFREATDYPFTDPYRRSQWVSGVDPSQRFNPEGTTNSSAHARRASDPFLSFLKPVALNGSPSPDHQLDWLHVSNFSPDGSFVNLFNLRNNPDAKPGFTPGPGNLPGEISAGLTLLDANGDPTLNRVVPLGDPNPNWTTAQSNVPAHWSMYQLNAFRPARDTLRPPALPNGADSKWSGYQWADADGDGFLDSRWFELVDAWDPANPVSLLPNDSYRWFVAARCIDLSALVNVNTAMDFVRAPMSGANEKAPLGLVPEVDLRRLLTLDDLYFTTQVLLGAAEGYEQLGLGADPYIAYDQAAAQVVGERGYFALRHLLMPNRTEVPPTDPPNSLSPFTFATGDDRWSYYANFASGIASTYGPLNTLMPGGFWDRGPFGPVDLLELLTYRGVNDPANLSRLEQTMGGRLGANPSDPMRRLSPLRDNRSLLEERPLDRALALGASPPTPGTPGSTEARATLRRSAYDIRQLITTLSGARQIRSDVIPWNTSNLNRSELKADAWETIRDSVSRYAASQQSGGTIRLPLFEQYVQGLMPYAATMLKAWLPRNNPVGLDQKNRTLYFGYDPEIALRAAAHMTVNMLDSFDVNDEPTAVTVKLTQQAVNSTLGYPILDLDNGVSNPQLRRLAPSAGEVYAPPNDPYVHVYGIEVQPFIAQVTSFVLYTDAPMAAGGDDDTDVTNEITIRGTVTTAPATAPAPTDNKDYLGQILAFQITNPFDREVPLDRYYFEYGVDEYIFRVPASAPQPDRVLAPGETKVFYAQSCDDMQERWINVFAQGDVQAWANDQFTVTDPGGNQVLPVRLEIIDKTSQAVISTPLDFFKGAIDSARLRAVYLWYDLPDSGSNWRENNILMDRLRDPSTGTTATLDVRMPQQNVSISGTQGGPEGENDNTGFTIALNATIKRKDDPGAPSIPRGAIPAFCLEGRWTAQLGSLSNSTDTPVNPGSLSGSDFQAPHGGTEVDDILDPASVGTIVTTLTTPSHEKTGDSIGLNLENRPFVGNQLYPPLYPEIIINNARFQATIPGGMGPGTQITTLRLTDMLLPLGIGPMQAMIPQQNPDVDPYSGWMTLSEALAVALNYSNPPATTDSANLDYNFQAYRNIGKASVAANAPGGALDRGNLVLDDFAPFEDLNTNGVFDATDKRRMPGIPLALNVLNMFSAFPGADRSLTQYTPGLININTAPVEVKRLLPLLSPTTEPGSAGGYLWDGWKASAGLGTSAGLRNASVPESAAPSPQSGSDIAAAMVAYRDQFSLTDRSGRLNDYSVRTIVAPPGTNVPVTGTSDWGAGIQALRGTSRNFQSGSQVLPGAPGFGSTAELMCVVRRNNHRQIAANNPRLPNSMDFLGYDQNPPSSGVHIDSGSKGMASSLYTDPAVAGGAPAPDTIPNNYAEKLLIAAGLMNSVTVRSDIYAVWFVVHGYSRADCEGLGPRDPLVPSIAKRYLMVLDRSNVTRRGERPKILLVTEVPMSSQ